MMKFATFGVLALGLMPLAAPAATVINFDDLPGFTPVGASYSGVTFSNALTSGITLAGSSTPNAIESISSGYQPLQDNPISAVFAVAASFVSLTGLDIGANGFVLKAFDAVTGGNLVQMASFTGVDLGIDTFATLSVSGSSIWRVEFSQISDVGVGDGMAFDDFTYELASVPVPASLPLGLAGVGALAFLSRRRKAA